MFPKWMDEVHRQGVNNPKPSARLLEAPGRPGISCLKLQGPLHIMVFLLSS